MVDFVHFAAKEMCAKLVESFPKIFEATSDAKCIFMKDQEKGLNHVDITEQCAYTGGC